MKTLKLSVIAVLFASFAACAQKSTVPVNVNAAFMQKFPNAKKVSWDKENETEWEAEFNMNGQDYSANFSSTGNWMETEYEIKKTDIPTAVKKTLDTEFAGYDIEEAELSETTKGKVYEFSLEKNDTDMEVAISPEGKVIKKEMKSENAAEDKD